MKIHPRGSEGRKWDLHVHVPGTKLNDGYGNTDLATFCQRLEHSDVAAFGITDYFSAEVFFRVRAKHAELFPNSTKVLFPNIELRLSDVVNRQDEVVDIHLILRPDVTEETTRRLLGAIRTETTVEHGRALT